MQLKRAIPYIVVGIIGIFLINLIASNFLLAGKAASKLETGGAIRLHILATLYCFLLGALLEWRTVVKLIKKEEKLSFSTLLIPGVIILLISSISPIIILMRFGLNLPFPDSTTFLSFFIGPLSNSSKVQNLLAVVAGSVIIKSLSKNAPAVGK